MTDLTMVSVSGFTIGECFYEVSFEYHGCIFHPKFEELRSGIVCNIYRYKELLAGHEFAGLYVGIAFVHPDDDPTSINGSIGRQYSFRRALKKLTKGKDRTTRKSLRKLLLIRMFHFNLKKLQKKFEN